MQRKLFFLFLLFMAAGVQAQNQDSLMIRKLADDILESGKAYENLRLLCKTVGPVIS